MKKKNERWTPGPWTSEKLQFGCLAALGIICALMMVTTGRWNDWIGYGLARNYLMALGFLFLGLSAASDLSVFAKRRMKAGIIAVAWFAAAQTLQFFAGQQPAGNGLWWSAYLLAFPFAAVMGDGGRQKGLRMIVGTTLALGLLLAAYAGMLAMDILPAGMREDIYWDGARLTAITHPNANGSCLMMGTAAALFFFFGTETRWKKGLLLVAVAAQFVTVVLTNSRTSVFITSALVAGAVFFLVLRDKWKRCLAGGLAALAVFVSLVFLADAIYDKHYEVRLAQYNAELREEQEAALAEEAAAAGAQEAPEASGAEAPAPGETEAAAPVETAPAPEVKQVTKLPTVSGQGTLSQDMKNFNGRTSIWKAVLRNFKYHPSLLLTGSADVGAAIKAGDERLGVTGAHNTWMEMLASYGIPGLLLALYFTFLAVRGSLFLLLKGKSSMQQKSTALLVLCLMLGGLLEEHPFNGYYQFISVVFFLCTGYVDLWREEAKHPERV